MKKVNNELVTIITPSFNRAHLIEICIKSVMSQTYSNIEHIIIDGGSTDNTKDVLKKYDGKYNLKWISEKDSGMYDAINKGLKMAKGTIIAYLNTDDAYFPWSVEVAVKNLQKGNQIIYGEMMVEKRYKGDSENYIQFYPEFSLKHFLYYSSIGQPTVFLRREVFEKVGYFDLNFSLIADCEFWIRCASNGLVLKKVNELLAIQIDHEQTLRETYSVKLQEEFSMLRRIYGNGYDKSSYFPLQKKDC